jgi:hypothetical protein
MSGGSRSLQTHNYHTMQHKYICRTPNSYGVGSYPSEAFYNALVNLSIAPARMQSRRDRTLNPSDLIEVFRFDSDSECSINDMGRIDCDTELEKMDVGDTDGELELSFMTLAYEAIDLKPLKNLAELLGVLKLDRSDRLGDAVDRLEDCFGATFPPIT